jgi:FKBP-type peptidyl-prolyl cis-trans isomerase
MMMKSPAYISLRNLLYSLTFLMIMISCRGGRERQPEDKPSDYKESLINANKELVRTESEQIDDFIARHGWQMTETATGLRYMVYKKGIGPTGQKGKVVKLNYSMTLLTGDTVYSSSSDGPMQFVAGQGQVISGLEEAILLLNVGDRAKIIIPSHLAFGLIGDQNKIRHKASLVYDVEFVTMY